MMTPTGWFLAADTVVTAAALIFAALAWWRVGNYLRQCRSTVQCYQGLAERALEDTQPHLPLLVDDQPSGRHALVEPRGLDVTDLASTVGDLDDNGDDDGEREFRVPRYYLDHEADAREDTVPRYYFAELSDR